jgi:hypothetical protein
MRNILNAQKSSKRKGQSESDIWQAVVINAKLNCLADEAKGQHVPGVHLQLKLQTNDILRKWIWKCIKLA